MHQRFCSKSYLITFTLCIVFHYSFGQSYWSIQNDNDLYFSKDYYYSNGLFLDYGTTSKTNNQDSFHLRLGQEIYNPSFRYVTDSKRYDYPYSGFLYLKVKRRKTSLDRASELELTTGITGKASLAKQLQNWYHTTFLNLNNLAWEDPMPQKILINVRYNHLREWTIEEDLKIGMEVGAQLGLEKTYVQHRAFILLNGMSLLSLDNPIDNHRQSGFIFGVQQQYLFQDFMIQGPLDHSNTLSRELVPYRITLMAGPLFYLDQWVIKGIWNYRSKDNSSQRHPWHPYMSVAIIKTI